MALAYRSRALQSGAFWHTALLLAAGALTLASYWTDWFYMTLQVGGDIESPYLTVMNCGSVMGSYCATPAARALPIVGVAILLSALLIMLIAGLPVRGPVLRALPPTLASVTVVALLASVCQLLGDMAVPQVLSGHAAPGVHIIVLPGAGVIVAASLCALVAAAWAWRDATAAV